jgi:hypothetical protein
MNYPGDTATPEQVAVYFKSVAESYDLPGILPVMTSCVELTAAWVLPGDVKDVTGYLVPADHWSVGYFQQQYDGNPEGKVFGWGTYDQCIDAEYAVNRFCQEAVKFVDYEWNEDTTDPEVLGRWCQAVQRSGVPDAYEDKGYPMARDLLAGTTDKEQEYPQITISFNDSGWGLIEETGEWARIKSGALGQDDALKVNDNDWLWVKRKAELEVVKFKWPDDANDDPIPGAWSYQDRHPTRYTWRSDVEEWARYLVQNYDVWCNTYYDHPETYWKTPESIDVWGPAGRNDPIDPTIGAELFNLLMYYEGEPTIDWMIWQANIYGWWNDWYAEPFGTDNFSWHYDHIHVTYM